MCASEVPPDRSTYLDGRRGGTRTRARTSRTLGAADLRDHTSIDAPIGGALDGEDCLRCRRRRELRVIERVIGTARREQLVMRALLDDFAVLHHEDEVGITDRRQPVRDDEARPPLA